MVNDFSFDELPIAKGGDDDARLHTVSPAFSAVSVPVTQLGDAVAILIIGFRIVFTKGGVDDTLLFRFVLVSTIGGDNVVMSNRATCSSLS